MTIHLAGYDLAIRELILGLLALVGLYIFFVLWRVRRLKRRAKQPVEPTLTEAEAPFAPSLNTATQPLPEPIRPAPPPAAPPPPPAPPPSTKADRTLPDTNAQNAAVQEAFIRNFRNDLAQMRGEMDALREALRGELASLRDELRQEINMTRASQTVSPIYGDAVQMATLGHDAATIAERCGIARAEAELVVALVQSQKRGA